MTSSVLYLPTIDSLFRQLEDILSWDSKPNIYISGNMSKEIYRGITEIVNDRKYFEFCKVVIPRMLTNKDGLNVPVKKFVESGGQVRINSNFHKEFIVVDSYALLLSFSKRVDKSKEIQCFYENSIITNDVTTVGIIKSTLEDAFSRGRQIIV